MRSPEPVRSTTDSATWEARLLALNALVDLARQHAVADEASREQAYRLERALGAVTSAVAAPSPAAAETVHAAVAAFGETLGSLGSGAEHRR